MTVPLGAGPGVAAPTTGPEGPLLPRYGGASLADLLPTVLGERPDGARGAVPGLPDSDRVCLLVVDGLGLGLLRRNAEHAPFLASLLEAGTELTAGFPSTTATSLSSLGTGLPPGEHGILGFEMYLPGADLVLNCLRWDPSVDPHRIQPRGTAFERGVAAGRAVSRVGPASFDGSGLTEAALRGGTYLGAETPGERVAAATAALREGDRALVYVYFGDLDATGHRQGCDSLAWRLQLQHVDRLAVQLADALPPDGLLVVTADHGMVDVPRERRFDLARMPDLDEGVRLLAGEPRALYVHAVDGARGDVLAAWQEAFSDVAWVVDRDEAISAGWFGGTVAPGMAGRIGDVVVACREPVAVVDSRRMRPQLLALVGMHGSLTAEEQLVPLLWATA